MFASNIPVTGEDGCELSSAEVKQNPITALILHLTNTRSKSTAGNLKKTKKLLNVYFTIILGQTCVSTGSVSSPRLCGWAANMRTVTLKWPVLTTASLVLLSFMGLFHWTGYDQKVQTDYQLDSLRGIRRFSDLETNISDIRELNQHIHWWVLLKRMNGNPT